MSAKIVNDYYFKRRGKLIKNFDNRLEILRDLLTRKFNIAKIEDILSQIKAEFEKLISEIPYIGGQKNPMTTHLIGGIYDLAIFRILEKEGFKFSEIGKLFYEYCDLSNKIRKKGLEKIGKDPSQYPFEPEYMEMTKKMCETSKIRTYPDDWIMDYVEGDNKTFDWGFNFYQCGIHKVYKRLDAEKYTPFVCLSDFSEANILGFGFTRTQTLGCGGPICDHRYVKNYKTPRAWPPDNIEEFKLKLE